MFQASANLKSFQEKLKLWYRLLKQEKVLHFKTLDVFLNENNMKCQSIPEIVSYCENIIKEISEWFESDTNLIKDKSWVVLPFAEEALALISDDDFEIKEELVNLQSDIMMKNHSKEKDNAPEFWIEQQQIFPILSKAALQILMAFSTS